MSNSTPAVLSETVENIPVRDLRLYDRHTRKHSAEQLEKLATSYRTFGWTNPILVDEHNVIICGDGRLKMARKIGLDEVPCLRVGGLSDAQKRGLRIADNRIALDAVWDDAKLREEIAALASEGFDLDALGMDEDELADLLRDLGGADPDAAPAAPETPVTVSGDVWLIGDHRIICGDAMNPETVKLVLGEDRPNVMVTDPPHGADFEPDKRGLPKGDKEPEVVLNDDRADWTEAWRLFPGHVAYVWHTDRSAADTAIGLHKTGYAIRAQIVWVKPQVTGRGHYHTAHEPLFAAERDERSAAEALVLRLLDEAREGKPISQEAAQEAASAIRMGIEPDHEVASYAVRNGQRSGWRGDRKQSTVWNIDPLKARNGHATQKPVDCMRKPILHHSEPNETIYDPFAGSGTTIIACEMTARRAIAIEVNPAYVDVCLMRYALFTNRDPIHAETGKSFVQMAKERGVTVPKTISIREIGG